jgi:hypothetical protein
MKRSFHIECNESQMGVLKDALDFYERILGLGQLEELEMRWRMNYEGPIEDLDEKSCIIRHCLYGAKRSGWGLSPHVSMSIRSETVPKDFRIAYDMTQIIRKKISDARIEELEGSHGNEDLIRHLKMTVDRDDFWASSDEEPIKVSFSSINEE